MPKPTETAEIPFLTPIDCLPTDAPIAGVHVVSVTEHGHIVMGWNKASGLLETVGGRIEPGESIEEALQREAWEEAGICLQGPYRPFASFYWESTQTYTVWFLAHAATLHREPPGFETSGRLVCNIATAKEIVRHLAHDPSRHHRLAILTWAEERLSI